MTRRAEVKQTGGRGGQKGLQCKERVRAANTENDCEGQMSLVLTSFVVPGAWFREGMRIPNATGKDLVTVEGKGKS